MIPAMRLEISFWQRRSPIDPPKDEYVGEEDDANNRNGGGGGGPNDPLIRAVIQKLPRKGPWSAKDRLNWIKMLMMAFNVTYGDVEIDDSDIATELGRQ